MAGFLDPLKIVRAVFYAFSIIFRSQWHLIISGFILFGLIVTIPFFQNNIFGKIVDATISYKDGLISVETIIYLIIALILSSVLPSIFELLDNLVETNLRFNASLVINLYLLEKINNLDIATLEGTEFNDLYRKAMEKGMSSPYQLVSMFIDSSAYLLAVVLGLIILSFVDKLLLLYAILAAIPVLVSQIVYGKQVYWVWDLNVDNRRKYYKFTNYFETARNLTEVKIFRLGKFFINKIKNLLESFDAERKTIEKNKLVFEICATIITSVFMGLGLWRIIGLTLAGLAPIGEMYFAYATFRRFNNDLSTFFRRFSFVIDYANCADYWKKLSELKPQISDEKDAKVLPDNSLLAVEFNNVSFKYDGVDSYALRNISFTIQPGEKIAIVGLSGAGKTTLIKLLCRIYDPSEGEILVNGVNLKDVNLQSWQDQIAVLFQDYSQYSMIVKDIISLGNIHVPLDENKIKEAAKIAEADQFIERLPKKYDQLVWKGFEDGVEFSKGENQRLALARVMYRNAPITILDEPTASVDALSEAKIFETLEALPDDKTVVLISHRFSTVKNADKILVIEMGELVESGKHTDLMKKADGLYAKLYKVQKESYS